MTTFDRIISATVKTSGEVIEYNVKTPGEVSDAYDDVEAHIEAYRKLKNSLMNTSIEMMKREAKEKK